MFQDTLVNCKSGTLNIGVGPGSGPPLLLLHGVLRRWSDFVPLLPSLACRWQVHALDFRGHGRSSWVSGKYHVADYVEDALSVLESFDEPAVVYGHSLGAMVAAAVATAAPARVRAIVLEDPPFETMGSGLGETNLQSLFAGYQACLSGSTDIATLTDRLAEIVLRTPGQPTTIRLGDVRDRAALRVAAAGLIQMDPDVLTPIVAGQWLDRYDVESTLRGIQCSTLVLQADPGAGGMLSDDDVTRLEAAVTDCSTIRFPGVGHLIHWSATSPLLNATVAFLESLRS